MGNEKKIGLTKQEILSMLKDAIDGKNKRKKECPKCEDPYAIDYVYCTGIIEDILDREGVKYEK